MSEDDRPSPIHPLLRAALEKGASVYTDADALKEAIQLDDLPSLRVILAQCPDVPGTLNDPNSDLWTPLEVAAGYGRLEAIRLLVAQGADVNGHSRFCGGPLFRAFEDSQAEAVRMLLELGADPNSHDVGRYLPGGEPALVSAVWWAGEARHNGSDGTADRAIVRALLGYGADVNAVSDGKSALMTAVHNAGPDPQMVRLLLEKGADIHMRDPNGWTALDWARHLVEEDLKHGHIPRPESVEVLHILEEAERPGTTIFKNDKSSHSQERDSSAGRRNLP